MPPVLLRIHARTELAGPPRHLGDLRVLLVADVLLRTAGLYGRPALIGLGLPVEPSADDLKALTRAAERLNVHPPAAQGSPRDIPAALGGPVDVEVALRGSVCPDAPPAPAPRPARIDVGAVEAHHPLDPSADPLALRLVLLTHTPARPVRVTSGALAEADRTLARWRRRVAGWAREPSRPVHAETVRAARAHCAQGLDTPTVLELLHRLEESEEVPAGARFETFVHLDRVLALELAREVGQ